VDHVLIAFLVASSCLMSLAAAGHALLHKRDSRSALVWMSLNLTLPLIGPFLYWCMGINRISRRARSWQESGRRLNGADIYPLESSLETTDPRLPDAATHLQNLHALANRVVTTRLREGNRITPLIDGEEAYPAMLVAIRRAQESINISSYIFDADGIGAEFVAHLVEASERGVEVRVMIDALGEKYSRISPHKSFHGTHVRFERYLPLQHGAYINLRNHRKLLILDGREAFTGGMNISDRHLVASTPVGKAVHDVHFCVQGPIVADLQRAFLEDWFFVTGARLDTPLFFPTIEPCGNALIRSISDGPNKDIRKLEQIIMGALSCARDQISIMTPYFIPDRAMTSALITTALRGVKVRILLPGYNNLPFVHWASRSLLWELIANDISVFYQPAPFVHTKLMLVDQVWALVGSANLDTRSLRLNFELDMSVFDASFSAAINRHFEKALSAAHEITLSELEQRSLPCKLRDNFARLFSPYL
jgi:cardiolipin synthase